MLGRPHINPSSLEVQLLSLRWTHPAGTTRPLLATALTTCCTCHLSALPLHDSLRHRVRGANKGMLPNGKPRHNILYISGYTSGNLSRLDFPG